MRLLDSNAACPRRWQRWALASAAALLVTGLTRAPLIAHHSFANYYLESDTIEIEGDIVEFQYRNPHSWVHVDGREGAFGQARVYAAEWASVSRLESDGITRGTLKVGDHVRVWASPNKNPNDNRVRLKRIARPADGWSWGQNRRGERTDRGDRTDR